MKGSIGRFCSKTISLLLAFSVLLTAVPMAIPVAVTAEETVIGSSSSLLSLDEKPPASYATATNPYGYDKDVAFTLSVGHELLYLGGADTKKQTSVLNGDDTGDLKEYLKEPNKKEGSYALPSGTWNWVKAIAFDDQADEAKDDKVLFVGVKESNQRAYAWVLDYPNNTISGLLDLGNMDWIGSDYEQYMSTSLFELAAGDFDGDGVDSLLVYAPLNLNGTDSKGCTLYELSYKNANLNIASTVNDLLMAQYIKDQSNRTYTDSSNSVEAARDKLAVSMQVTDLNGDNLDDLAVLSYSHHRNSGGGVEYYKPQLKICYGGKGVTIDRLKPTESSILTVANVADTITLPVAASLAAGDFNGDGFEDLYVVGVKATCSSGGSLSVTDDIWYMQCFYGNGDNTVTNGGYTTVTANEWFSGGFYPDDGCYGKVMAAGVAISGQVAADMLFVAGTLYKVSTGTPIEKLTGSYFNSEDKGIGAHLATNTFVQSVVVGNFDNNGAGREQVAFTIGIKQKGQDDYYFKAGYVSGKDFDDGTYEDGSTCYGEASGFYCMDIDDDSEYIHEDKGDDPDEGLNCLLIALDFDQDSIVAKYRGAGYVYTDPEVKAVLQAAPYFGDVTTSGKNSTGYSLETSYSHGDSESNAVNGSVGFAAGGGFPGVFSLNVTASVTGGWTDTFTKTVNTSYKDSFAAGSEDVVVVHRIPLIAYSFDIQNENGEWSNEAQLEFTVPQEPVYETMTVEGYNAFATTYNTMMENAGATSFYPLVPIDAAANWLEGNEGNPYAYNQTGWGNQAIGAEQISKGSFALGKSNATNSVSWSEGNSETSSFTATCGAALTFSVLFGPKGVGGGGVSLAGNYTHGWGISTTTGSASGMTCAVQDLDGTGLLAKGMPQNVLDMYSFTWTFGQWERHLSGKSNNKTPFLGYALTNVSSPAPAVKDLTATTIDSGSIQLDWSKPTAYQGGPAVTGYYVYRVEENGSYTKVSERLGAQSTSYTVKDLEEHTAYTFVVTSTGTFSGESHEGAWSNEATATTRVNTYRVTYYADDPKAANLQAYTTGHVSLSSGGEVSSHAVVTFTATAADDNSRVIGIELDRGNGTDIQFIEADETQMTAQCALIVTGNTTIRVLTKRAVDQSNITYTAVYKDNDQIIGTVTATVGGLDLPAPGGLVTAPVTFTAVPAEGYELTGWNVTADGVSETVSAANMNPFTLTLEKNVYTVEACFELIGERKAILTVHQPSEGGYIRLTDENGKEIPLNSADSAEVPIGSHVTVTAVCSTGYVLHHWSGDAAEQTATAFTVTANDNLTFGAVFTAPIKFKLSYAVTSGEQSGSIAVNPAVTSGGYVAAGTELTVSVAAADGYRLDTVRIVNGSEVIDYDLNDRLCTEAQRMFALEATAHIEVNFVPIETYQVNLRLPSNSHVDIMVNNVPMTVSGSRFEYTCQYMDDVTVTLTPQQGFYLAGDSTLDWQYIGNGCYQATYTDLTQDISGVISLSNSSGHALPDDGSGYAITNIVRTPSGFYPENQVAHLGSLTFTVIPTDTRGIKNVTLFDPYEAVRNEVITDNGDGTWQVYVPSVDQSIEVDVEMNPGYTFATEVSEGGTLDVTLNGRQLSKYGWTVTGDVVEFKATPDEGYELVSLTVNGTEITDGRYTVQNSAFKIQAVFEKTVYALPQSTADYTVENVQVVPSDALSADGKIDRGATVTYTVIPREGLDIADAVINAGSLKLLEDGCVAVSVYDVQSPIVMELALAEHEHSWNYTTDEETDSITAVCAKSYSCPIDTASVTVEEPSDTTFDGTVKTVRLTGSTELLNPQVTHCCEGGCKTIGTHTAVVILGEKQVTMTFEIQHPIVTLEDVTAVFYHVNGVRSLAQENMAKADLNCDGVVDLQDAVTLFYLHNGLL